MAEVLEALAAGGEPQGLLSVDGGLTRSRYFLQFFASVAGRPIVVPANPELTAYGAGLLAARGSIPAKAGPQVTIDPEPRDVDRVARAVHRGAAPLLRLAQRDAT